MKRFQGGLVFKARRLVYHSTLGWRVIKKKKRVPRQSGLLHRTAEALNPRPGSLISTFLALKSTLTERSSPPEARRSEEGEKHTACVSRSCGWREASPPNHDDDQVDSDQ